MGNDSEKDSENSETDKSDLNYQREYFNINKMTEKMRDNRIHSQRYRYFYLSNFKRKKYRK